MICLFDTETTGFVNRQAPPKHPIQPRLLQFAALVLNEAGEQQSEHNFMIVQPAGTQIHPSAAAAHGLTLDIVNASGLTIQDAYARFKALREECSTWLAFNAEFDIFIMRIFAAHAAQPDLMAGAALGCIMRPLVPVLKLPGRYNDYKFPKLAEAHKFCTGHDFENAHDALADVKASAEVYRWMLKNDIKFEPV